MSCLSVAPVPASHIWRWVLADNVSGRVRGYGSSMWLIWSISWIAIVNSNNTILEQHDRLAHRLCRVDLVVLDELGYLPLAVTGGQRLFHSQDCDSCRHL